METLKTRKVTKEDPLLTTETADQGVKVDKKKLQTKEMRNTFPGVETGQLKFDFQSPGPSPRAKEPIKSNHS